MRRLGAAGLADRALVFELATAVASQREVPHLLLDSHVVLVDVPIDSPVERDLVAAVAGRARSVLATVADGDDRALCALGEVLAVTPERPGDGPGEAGGLPADRTARDALWRVQHQLFAPVTHAAPLDPSVAIFSAPGESRECVELARRLLREAERGVPFDRMAILLRAPGQYRVHLEEALARAGIPAHFEQGTVLPDPSGRAFLALLACAAEGLSARRFAEYLSLGEVPRATAAGAPPAESSARERWVPPDEELLPAALVRAEASLTDEPDADDAENDDDAEALAPGEPVRAPWRWERLLVEAAVIGGRDRWTRRLDGLAARLVLEATVAPSEGRARAQADLVELRRFAEPLLDTLAALPAHAAWGPWLDCLAALATCALRRPDRVLSVLAALAPMRDVGPVELREVQLVLEPPLVDLHVPMAGSHVGRVLVASTGAARGRAFDVVFVPGLAERMFPQKLVEDPLLLDAARAQLGRGLATQVDRLGAERLALRLAIGAARRQVVLSYPRIDVDQGRPRVPSFYGLEVLQAAEGALPGFEELARRADVTGAARIGWPAPADPLEAIDEAEHDLALLDALVRHRARTGAAHYLLGANVHLARSLRARARRWELRAWKPADGLIVSTPEGRAALAAHALTARSFSPTALEQLAACPLRFAYRTIARLETRATPEPIEALGALERGSLVHEVQFELLGALRDTQALPVSATNLEHARDLLDTTLNRVAARYRDELAPAIERVWVDGIASLRADLREWLRLVADDREWIPRRFELAFGLDGRDGRDPASVDDPVRLACGIAVRGSIDLVEESVTGALRATDHKTGKPRARHPTLTPTALPVGGAAARGQAASVVWGGRTLQPVLYALVLEQLVPGTPVTGGRLDYCTTRGGFSQVVVPLDEAARAAAQTLAATLEHHLTEGFFPAAPAPGECRFCDFRSICGPSEEQRTSRKQPAPLAQLARLRGLP